MDAGILAILASAVVFGLYKGFLVSALNFAGYWIAYLFASLFYGNLATTLSRNSDVVSLIGQYTQGSTPIASHVELNATSVYAIADEAAPGLLAELGLTPPFDSLIARNVVEKAFEAEGATTLGEYADMTVAGVATDVLCFLLILVAAYVMTVTLINALNAAMKFPVLAALDSPLGGAVGFLRGAFICAAAFSALPVVLTILDVSMIRDIVYESAYASWFYPDNFVLKMLIN